MRGALLITVFGAAILFASGCASYRIGPRAGVDIPLTNAGTTGPVSASSSSPGALYGASVELLGEHSWGGRVDVQLRSMHTDIEAYHVFTTDGMVVETRSSITASMQTLDIPIMVMFAPIDTSWVVQPFAGLGATLSYPSSSTASITSTHIITTSSGTNSVPAVVTTNDDAFNSGTMVSLLITSGCSYRPHPSVELRAEARVSQMITNADAMTFTWDWRTPGNQYYMHPTVSTIVPTLTMGLTLSVFVVL